MKKKLKNLDINSFVWLFLVALPLILMICYVIINKENYSTISFESLCSDIFTWFNNCLNFGDLSSKFLSILKNFGVNDNIYIQFVINYALYFILICMLKLLISVFTILFRVCDNFLGGKNE